MIYLLYIGLKMLNENGGRESSTKQSLFKVVDGYPTKDELVDRRPEFRFIAGKGMYLTIKRNGIIYTQKMSVGFN